MNEKKLLAAFLINLIKEDEETAIIFFKKMMEKDNIVKIDVYDEEEAMDSYGKIFFVMADIHYDNGNTDSYQIGMKGGDEDFVLSIVANQYYEKKILIGTCKNRYTLTILKDNLYDYIDQYYFKNMAEQWCYIIDMDKSSISRGMKYLANEKCIQLDYISQQLNENMDSFDQLMYFIKYKERFAHTIYDPYIDKVINCYQLFVRIKMAN